MKTKPRILLCWGYYRKGWIEVFEKLNDDFEFHYLFWLSKSQELEVYTECPKHYWEDFKSGNDVLNKIKPDKVVFMGINNLNGVSLQFTGRRKKVTTYVMQHGLFHDLKTNVYLDEQMAKNRVAKEEYTTKKEIYKWRFFQLFFLLRSLRLRNIPSFFQLLKWQWDERRMMHLLALAKNHASFRRADYYIVYTKFNGHFFKEIDGINEDRMIPVGVPEFDKFFEEGNSNPGQASETGYNLLIDSALTYNEVFKTHGIIDQASYNNFISKLNEASLAIGKRLIVKLHPFSYQNKNFVQHPNISYIHDCDVVKLIKDSDHIFGFDSTLLIISIYLKPTVLFTIHDFGYFQNNIKEINAAPVIKYDDFTVEELMKAMDFKPTEKASRELIDRFLYAVDGRTFERVREALAS